MSMLTSMCDRLRTTAEKLRENYTFVGFGGVVNRDPAIHDAASDLDDAAETIEELRDRCHDLQADNAKLRELGPVITGETSDGYHTFNELYHHRAVLFSVIVRDHPELAWKAKAHHDGTMYDGMFIVGIETPQGQATYHYDIDPYWDTFDCREVDRAPEWDGHTPDDAIARIATLCVSDATLARQGDALKAENAKLQVERDEWHRVAESKQDIIDHMRDVRDENARYRELVEILRRDWLIEASWDGLRKVWYVGLTEDGVRERDERDAKVMEAANIEIGKLRELAHTIWLAGDFRAFLGVGELEARMRELGIEVE